MAGQGFDPNFTFSWPTARIGVMEGDSAVQASMGPSWKNTRRRDRGFRLSTGRMEQTRADYDRWLDLEYAAARGHCDALIDPADTRAVLSLAFDAACFKTHTEHVPIQLIEFGSQL